MHPGQETTSFSTGEGKREGGCTERHANSVWDQPRARARRRECRGEGTGPSFGHETTKRTGSPRLFLPPSTRSHFYFCASVRANTVSRLASSQSSSFAGFVLRWSKPKSGDDTSTWALDLRVRCNRVKPLTPHIISHVPLTGGWTHWHDRDHSPAKTGNTFLSQWVEEDDCIARYFLTLT